MFGLSLQLFKASWRLSRLRMSTAAMCWFLPDRAPARMAALCRLPPHQGCPNATWLDGPCISFAWPLRTPQPTLGPGSVPNFTNSMTGIDFPNRTQRYRPGEVRDRFGWLPGSVRASGNYLRFFSFRTHRPTVTGTHNPLVPGSSPGGPTNSIAINDL